MVILAAKKRLRQSEQQHFWLNRSGLIKLTPGQIVSRFALIALKIPYTRHSITKNRPPKADGFKLLEYLLKQSAAHNGNGVSIVRCSGSRSLNCRIVGQGNNGVIGSAIG